MKDCRVIQTGKGPGRFLVHCTVSYTQMLHIVTDLHGINFLMGGCQYFQDKNITSTLTLLSFLTRLNELGFHYEAKANLSSFSQASLCLN